MANWPPGLPLASTAAHVIDILERRRIHAIYLDYPADIEPRKLGFPTYFFDGPADLRLDPKIGPGEMALVTFERDSSGNEHPATGRPTLWIITNDLADEPPHLVIGYLNNLHSGPELMVPGSPARIPINYKRDRYAGTILAVYQRPGTRH